MADKQKDTPRRPELSLDDLRAKAEHIGQLAKDEVRYQTRQEYSRNVGIGVMVVALTVSFAYYLGTRRAARPRMRTPRA